MSLLAGHVALHVSGIPKDFDEKRMLEWLSEQCGNDLSIDSVKICRDASTRRSRGSGYINANPESAQKIKMKLNHKKLEDNELNITFKRHAPLSKEANLCFNNLNVSTTYESFEKMFSSMDDSNVNVVSTKLREIPNKKKVGYAQFETEDIAKEVIKKFDGAIYAGSTLKVDVFADYETRMSRSFTQVYVNNFKQISEDDLKKNFEKNGKVASAFIYPNNGGRETYAACISFENHDSAVKAIKELNGHSLDGQSSIVLVTRFLNKKQRKQNAKRTAEHKTENNLFVRQLPDDLTYEEMRAFFAKFGEIDSVRIMYDDKTHQSKGYGYCSFKKYEDTQKAKNTNDLNLKGAIISITSFIPQAQRGARRETVFLKTQRAATTHRPTRKGKTDKQKNVKQPSHHNVQPTAAAAPQNRPTIEAIPQAELDNMDEDDKHETFGEKIYEYVSANYKENPGKITGMILESFKKDYAALNNVIANGKIVDKINEAIEVLKKHGN